MNGSKFMSKKLSFDLTDENAKTLERIKKDQHIPYGQVINSLIEHFCMLSDDIRLELLEFCALKIEEIYKKMDGAGEYEIQTLLMKNQTYQNLSHFFNNEHKTDIDSIKIKPNMQKIDMFNGYLICPNDYIILNRDDAIHCNHASVVEVRDSDFGVPHFIFFSLKDVNNYTASDINTIEKLCVKEWPRFQEIIDSLVVPIPDASSVYMRYLNEEEFAMSPKIGHFPIYVENDIRYPINYQPPMGTKIIPKH